MLKLISVFALAAALGACVSFYDVARQGCMKLMSNEDMKDCLQRIQASQDEFKRTNPAQGKLEALPKEAKPATPCSRRVASGEPPCAE